ncbi:MAG: ABC transporter substrate-binding protein [Methylobacterium sp.]
MSHSLSFPMPRRRFLALTGGLGLSAWSLPSHADAKAAPTRVATLDYGLAETMLAIGVEPVAIASAADWTTWVVEPPLPPTVADLGAAQDPNLERLAALRPDLVLSTDFTAMTEPALSRIARVERVTLYGTGIDPLPRARAVTTLLGDMLERQAQAEAAITAYDTAIARLAARLAGRISEPVLLVSFMDPRHVRVYGRSGLYGNVLDGLGLRNAWDAPVNYWGFSTVGIEDLAAAPSARLVAVDPVAPDVWPTLARSPLWTGLPFVAAGRVSTIPPALMFGALPSAGRFARLLAKNLLEMPS